MPSQPHHNCSLLSYFLYTGNCDQSLASSMALSLSSPTAASFLAFSVVRTSNLRRPPLFLTTISDLSI